MRQRLLFCWLCLLAACTPTPEPVLPTLAVLDTALDATAVPGSGTPAVIVPIPDGELLQPLPVVTQPAERILITPTAPPSKTPTITLTPTITPSPTQPTTATATSTALIPPTRIEPFLTQPPVTAVVVQPVAVVCDSTWFFIEPRPAACPLAEATATQAVYQRFEQGIMIWVGERRAVYVLYNDFQQPAWQVFEDTYEEWMPETDSTWPTPPSPELFQPRRGFGTVWRTHAAVRERVGWVTENWEIPYSMESQSADDGTIWLADPDGGTIALYAGQQDWERFHFIPTIAPTHTPTAEGQGGQSG